MSLSGIVEYSGLRAGVGIAVLTTISPSLPFFFLVPFLAVVVPVLALVFIGFLFEWALIGDFEGEMRFAWVGSRVSFDSSAYWIWSKKFYFASSSTSSSSFSCFAFITTLNNFPPPCRAIDYFLSD